MNHLGTALLALLLLPKLLITPSTPRITIVTSESHFRVRKLDGTDSKHILATLNDPKTTRFAAERYEVTKRKYLSVLGTWLNS